MTNQFRGGTARPTLAVIVALLLFSAFAFAQSPAGETIKDLRPTVILISIDGYRSDYLQKYRTPTLSLLSRRGVRAAWMTPVYPSLTFPNHYSIATGLHPENHGIVGNNMYDRDFKATFSLGKREEVQNGRWWQGEPIWVTAEKQGLRAAAFFFPGTEAEIAGKRPTHWKTYDEKIPNFERVDTVLSWLDLPVQERPSMITMYFSDVDHAGHETGPETEDVKKAIGDVDLALTRLADGLKKRGIFNRVNLIIVSDHGMARVDPNHTVVLDDYFDATQAEMATWGSAVVTIFAKPGAEDAIYSSLKAKAPPQIRVYRKREVPARFHFNNNKRIGEIVIMAEEGWQMTSRERYRPAPPAADGKISYRGVHGYDNRLRSMRAFFIGHGPAFRRGAVVKPFQNIDLYNVMAKILRIKPAPNDGGLAAARTVLRSMK